MTHWYLVADGGGIACAFRCETPREALNQYLEAIGGVDLNAYIEIWEGDSNTSDMTVSVVTEAEALLADGRDDRWPEREVKTWYFRDVLPEAATELRDTNMKGIDD